MSGLYVPHELFGEFFNRRCRELVEEAHKGGQRGRELSKMGVTEFCKMIENEYYDCADDPTREQGLREASHPDVTLQ